MTLPRRLVSRATHRRRDLLDAERLFFDAYGRGGTHAGQDLVVPLGFFARRDVAAALRAWWAGGVVLDAAALERAWREEGGVGDAAVFERNLRHFLSLARPRDLVATH